MGYDHKMSLLVGLITLILSLPLSIAVSSQSCTANKETHSVSKVKFNDTLFTEWSFAKAAAVQVLSIAQCVHKCELDDLCVAAEWTVVSTHCRHLRASGPLPNTTLLLNDAAFMVTFKPYQYSLVPRLWSRGESLPYGNFDEAYYFSDGLLARENLVTGYEVMNDRTKIYRIGMYYNYRLAGYRGSPQGTATYIQLNTNEYINKVQVVLSASELVGLSFLTNQRSLHHGSSTGSVYEVTAQDVCSTARLRLITGYASTHLHKIIAIFDGC